MLSRWRACYRRIEAWHEEFFVAKWRAALKREARREQDLLTALLFLESLGVATPMGYYALELYPAFAESFHQWHRRMGIKQFPDAGFCC
jgi:hypothetical protein